MRSSCLAICWVNFFSAFSAISSYLGPLLIRFVYLLTASFSFSFASSRVFIREGGGAVVFSRSALMDKSRRNKINVKLLFMTLKYIIKFFNNTKYLNSMSMFLLNWGSLDNTL